MTTKEQTPTTPPPFKGLDVPQELREPLKIFHEMLLNIGAREGNYNMRRMASGMARLIELTLGEEVKTPPPAPQHHP